MSTLGGDISEALVVKNHKIKEKKNDELKFNFMCLHGTHLAIYIMLGPVVARPK